MEEAAARRLRALLQLALLEHVERRAKEHVAPVEDLVEERVHRAEHALVGEVLGAPGLHERLEVERPDEVGLHRALGELAREDVDALLFSPNDPDDLARQVLTLLNDIELSKRLADTATERALSKFTWHEAQKKLLKIYKKLLAD